MRSTTLIATILAATLTSTAFAGYKEQAVKDGGTISGTVKFDGKAPPAKPVGQDTEVCGTSTGDPTIVTKDGKLANVVVFLKKVKKGKAWTAEQKKVVSDQKSCVFVPQIALVAEGGTVEFKNSDSVLHNVKSTSLKNPSFNEGVEGGKSMNKTFKKGHEAIKVTCSVHSWMESWVVVMPHPYYTVTDAEGNFKISDVPAGKYKLIIWHGSMGTDCNAGVDGGSASKQGKSGIKIKVEAGKELKVEATFKK